MAGQTVEQKYGFEHPFKPDPLSRKALPFLTDGKELLDVGCGEGADSVFFARKGFTVTSIDRNKEHLNRFRRFCREEHLPSISVLHRNVVNFEYPKSRYDVILSLLVICCMKRSEATAMLTSLKRSVKPGGIMIVSARNYLDPEMEEYLSASRMIEPNTFHDKDDCCKFMYFVEKDRLRAIFKGFRILYYREGFARCKYNEHPKHGDSYIICRRER